MRVRALRRPLGRESSKRPSSKRKKGQRSTKLEKLRCRMTPLEFKEGNAYGLARGKLVRCSQGLGAMGDKAEPLLSPVSQSSKEWLGSEMKPEAVSRQRSIKPTAALSAAADRGREAAD